MCKWVTAYELWKTPKTLSVQFKGVMCHGFNLLAKPGRLWKRQGTGHSFNSLIRAVLKGHPITSDDVKYVYFSQRCLSFVVSCNSALLKNSVLYFNAISNVQIFQWGFVRVCKIENCINPLFSILSLGFSSLPLLHVQGCLHIICLLATFSEVWLFSTVYIIFPLNTK